MRTLSIFVFILIIVQSKSTLVEECAKIYRNNYMQNFPYISAVEIPNNYEKILKKIRVVPTVTTKVISVQTKYVYKNPVCVKYTKKKSYCKPNAAQNKEAFDKILTKEYFVGNQIGHEIIQKDTYNDLLITSSEEEPRKYPQSFHKTPILQPSELKTLLIEDRLDQLETIIPDYTRRRKFETSTITVTKLLSNNRAMATLLVKNCVPQGYDFCPGKVKKKKRKSRIATGSADSSEEMFYFG